MLFLRKFITDLKVNCRIMNENHMPRDRFLSSLGIAKKAGKIIAGSNMVASYIRNDNIPALVILSCDASGNTRKLVHDVCRYRNVTLEDTEYSMDALANAIGALHPVSCVAITDTGLANMLREKLLANVSQGGMTAYGRF